MKKLLVNVPIMIFVSWQLLHGLKIHSTATPQDAARRQEVWVRCILDQNEVGLLKHGFTFTIDNPSISLVRWTVDAKPEAIYLPMFNGYRRVYRNACSCRLQLDPGNLSPEVFTYELTRTQVMVAGLAVVYDALLHRLDLRAVTEEAALAPELVKHQGVVFQPPAVRLADQEVVNSMPTVHWLSTKKLDTDFAWITAFAYAWGTLRDAVAGINWKLIALLAALLLLLLWLCKRYHQLLRIPVAWFQSRWVYEIKRAALLLCSIVGLMQASPWLGRQLAWSLLAITLFVGMMYELVTPPSEQVFLGRLKRVIGFGLGIFVLPCLVRAWLFHWGL